MMSYFFYPSLLISFYIFAGIPIRTDNIILYSVFLFIFFKKIAKFDFIYKNFYLAFLFILVSFSGLLSTFLSQDASSFKYLKIISGIEAYISCVCFILLFDIFYNRYSDLLYILNVNIIICAFNLIPQLYFLHTGCNEILLMISGARQCGLGAADIALTGGRTAGFFDQIIEGGLACSIGLISLYFIHSINGFKKLYIHYFLIILISGYFVGSKLFYIFGLPIFIFLIIYTRKLHFLINSYSIKMYIFYTSMIYLVNYFWNGVINLNAGYIYIYRLFLPFTRVFDSNYFVATYTSGRISSESTVFLQNIHSEINLPESFFDKIYNIVFGGGYTNYTASDNAFFEVYREGGLLSLLIYGAIFLYIIYFVVKARYTKNIFFSLFALLIFILFGSIGSPLITANRVSFMYLATFLVFVNLSNRIPDDK